MRNILFGTAAATALAFAIPTAASALAARHVGAHTATPAGASHVAHEPYLGVFAGSVPACAAQFLTYDYSLGTYVGADGVTYPCPRP
jgi:hypothetical protein